MSEVIKDPRGVWRTARASRLSVFVDVASCFEAMRSCLLQAERSITIIGWDIDSRTPLVGDGRLCHDGFPETLSPFLEMLSRRKPSLTIRLLLWDFSTLYALEREAFPRYKLAWEGVSLVLDDTLPASASQHQKLLIVDDAVAFSGGLDLTIRRWDMASHPFHCPERCDPSGDPYDPFHDVQAVVDGEAARALADLGNERWWRACGERLAAKPVGQPWPQGVSADFVDIDVAISRTLPETKFGPATHEVEHLFVDMIATAEREIYIENQYLTSMTVADALARRLQEKPELEVLIIAPKEHAAWLEALTMRNGRIRFANVLKKAGGDRMRLVGAVVREGRRSKSVMIHSKVMIIDDTLVRIGSANLNNRSMGTDSECDLTIAADTGERRASVLDLRARLLSVHTASDAKTVRATLDAHGLIAGSRLLSSESHRLEDIDDGEPLPDNLSRPAETVGDPERPVDAARFLTEISADAPGSARRRAIGRLVVAAGVMAVLALAWTWFGGDAESALRKALSSEPLGGGMLAGAFAVFVIASLLFMPITLLIVGTTAALGLPAGLPLAAVGTLASAICGYALGRVGGKPMVRPLLGGRLRVIRDAIVRHGVLSVAAIRLVPVAPFTMVNMAAGAVSIRPMVFLFGTLLGMAPGFLILALLGAQFGAVLAHPNWASVMLGVALIALWVAGSFVARRLFQSKSSHRA